MNQSLSLLLTVLVLAVTATATELDKARPDLAQLDASSPALDEVLSDLARLDVSSPDEASSAKALPGNISPNEVSPNEASPDTVSPGEVAAPPSSKRFDFVFEAQPSEEERSKREARRLKGKNPDGSGGLTLEDNVFECDALKYAWLESDKMGSGSGPIEWFPLKKRREHYDVLCDCRHVTLRGHDDRLF